jgi:hypothetical protein
MYDFSGEKLLDREQVRRRLQRMTDAQLRRWGAAARYMCSPTANLGQPPWPNFVLQLEEALAGCGKTGDFGQSCNSHYAESDMSRPQNAQAKHKCL